MPQQSLNDSIEAVINLVPESGAIRHAEWRDKVLTSGISNGEEAMRRIFKTKLAAFKLDLKDGDTVLTLYVSRLPS